MSMPENVKTAVSAYIKTELEQTTKAILNNHGYQEATEALIDKYMPEIEAEMDRKIREFLKKIIEKPK